MKQQFNPKNYRPSSELQREAEQHDNNQRRTSQWSWRWFCIRRRFPALSPRPASEQHGNAEIIKFPSRKRQIMHTQLPDGPEAA